MQPLQPAAAVPDVLCLFDRAVWWLSGCASSSRAWLRPSCRACACIEARWSVSVCGPAADAAAVLVLKAAAQSDSFGFSGLFQGKSAISLSTTSLRKILTPKILRVGTKHDLHGKVIFTLKHHLFKHDWHTYYVGSKGIVGVIDYNCLEMFVKRSD